MKLTIKDFDGDIYFYTIDEGLLTASSNMTLEQKWFSDKYTWEIQDGRLWMFNKSRSMGQCFGYMLSENK